MLSFVPGRTRNFFGTLNVRRFGRWPRKLGDHCGIGGGEGCVGGSGVAFVAGGGGAGAGVSDWWRQRSRSCLNNGWRTTRQQQYRDETNSTYHGFLCMGHPTRLFWPCNRYNLRGCGGKTNSVTRFPTGCARPGIRLEAVPLASTQLDVAYFIVQAERGSSIA